MVTKDDFVVFLKEFLYPHECEYARGHYGDLNHVITETDPNDPGNFSRGKLKGTKFGIDANSHPNVDIAGLTVDQANDIYWDEFHAAGCDKLAEPLCFIHSDTATNVGAGRAKEFLAKTTDPSKYLDLREDYYHRLVEARPRFSRYLRGWLNRVNDLRKFAKL